jgi:hypothetical protein
MPRWSAERRDVPIARDVKTPRRRLRVPHQHARVPARTLRFSVLHSPSLARKLEREGKTE